MKLGYAIRKSKALHQHWTIKKGQMVPKAQFKTLDEAIAFMDKKHINKNLYHPYICPDCGLWHIGHIKGTKIKHKTIWKRQ